VPTFDAELNVYKQSCLVALDFGASPQPVPESVDILVNSISLSYCPLGGADFNVQILEPLIAQAKAVQAQNDRPIGWLLSVEFQENCPAAADMLMHSIAELSNAGYIGLMAPEVSGQPYSNFNDLPITPAPTASYAFFEGCADYYNGTRQTYYIRQNPQQCRCVPCDPSQELCTPFCGSSGLKCIGPTGLPAGDGATNLKCDAECVPFPDRTISYTDPGIDCSTIPELQKEENGCFALGYACQGDGSLADAMQGCYSICNVKTDLFADIDARVLNPAIPSARGLAEPEDGYASENSEGNLRYTPTTCYMQDYYSNFYNYQETQASSAFSQEYVIFDSKGEQNQCGRIDATGIFGDTAPCAAPDELPAVVIK